MDTFFDILETEDNDAVALFGRWINDYLRQVAEIDLDAPDIEFRTGEDPSMLAENLRLWRDKNIEEGRQEERQDVARRLLLRGLSLAEVTELTKLSPEEIAKVTAESSTQGK